VIGLGNMGRHHVRVYSENPNVTLVAVCDNNGQLATQFQEKYEVQSFTDYKEMMDTLTLDAVSIVASTRLHYDIAKYAILKGIHVLIEKPIADTIEKANELIALAAQKKVTLMVGHIERFNPSVQVVETLIKQGDIGNIITISTKRAGGFPTQIKDANVLIDLAVHDIDIIHTLIGKSIPTKVTINTGRAIAKDREDYADILLQYDTISAFVQVNWITPTRVRTLSVTGDKGHIQMDYIAQTVTLYKSAVSTQVTPSGDTNISLPLADGISIDVPKQEPLAVEIDHFITCVTTNRQPRVSGENARDALAIALHT